ncbi:LysM peptidoglycan-binding domain-containing protein [Methyloligella sp. 2.7D]|uniref:LysM peptidoglycan-binding domain-containing protein n=1 Tax=unclassified Methyloligella TaxID=2625955 RepID=UPI00157DCD8A|nr:LysM peptidoglycan-binding domain-containing protein [Methyloligella sp. GL2]QKP77202.1 LysM peptidoglycan-binding domain-containing protein [Methyloligella sp. GL2]
MGNKIVGIVVTVAFFLFIAVVGYRLYEEGQDRQQASAPPAAESSQETAEAPQPEERASEPEAGAESGEEPVEETAKSEQAAPSGEEEAESAPQQVPSFDVVRVERTGDAVMAGRASPGWKIEVQSDGEKIGETTADDAGQWTIVLDEPLPRGDHSLGLLATSPDGTSGMSSQQSVLVAMGEGENDEAVVALSEPGKATKILQEDQPEGSASGEPESQAMSTAQRVDSSATAGEETVSSEGEAAPGETEMAAAEPSQSATSKQPEPVMWPDGKPSEEEESASDAASQAMEENQVAATTPDEAPQKLPERPIQIKTVDYEDAGPSNGKLFVSGEAKPSIKILLYLDEQLVGETQSDAQGKWTVEADRYLPAGNHFIRADLVDLDNDIILGRTAVQMRRMDTEQLAAEAEAQRKAQETAQAGAAVGTGESAPSGGEASGRMAAAEMPEAGQASPAGQGDAGHHGPSVYTVRRGDTLWAIAEQYFGGGWRYTMIFKDNRGQIRNPNLIYPDQEFQIREQ